MYNAFLKNCCYFLRPMCTEEALLTALIFTEMENPPNYQFTSAEVVDRNHFHQA